VGATVSHAKAVFADPPTVLSLRFTLSLLAVIGVHSALLMPWASSMRSDHVLPAQPSMSVRLLAAPDGGAATSVPLGSTLPAALPSPVDMSPVAVNAPNQRDSAQAQSAELAVYQTASNQARAAVRAASSAEGFAATRPAAAVLSELTATKTDAKNPLTEPGGLPPAPSYFNAGTLDPGPKPLSDINPDYPTRAGQQQGLVVLRLLINEQGVVDNVAVVRATPAGYFEESALDAFGKALFSPGKLLGVTVKSQITVEVEFMPINRGATVSGRTY
jgi:periplasmic protein TonB